MRAKDAAACRTSTRYAKSPEREKKDNEKFCRNAETLKDANRPVGWRCKSRMG